jgi:hypothetical protein
MFCKDYQILDVDNPVKFPLVILGLQKNYTALGLDASTYPLGPGPAAEMLVWSLMLTGLLF